MRAKLIPNHRFQVITFHGIEIGKSQAAAIPADFEAEALSDPRLICETQNEVEEPEPIEAPVAVEETESQAAAIPAKKGGKK